MSPPTSLVELRRSLHQSPELSGQEHATAARIAGLLGELQPDALITGLGGHGVLATFQGAAAGPALLFRCELDALPIVEANTFAHRSRVDGVSHKCGHDGHMTIMVGFAQSLARQRPLRGKVHVLFQPAEETGDGARGVLADPRFRDLQPAMGFALHNLPSFPMHAAVVRDALFSAAVCSLILRFQGRTCHAMEPERGCNPSFAIAELLLESHLWNHNVPEDDDFRLVVPVHTRIGVPSQGISPGDAHLHFTLRAWTEARLGELQETVLEATRRLAAKHGLTFTHETVERFAPNLNHAEVTERVRDAAREAHLPVVEMRAPMKAGEDFGLFTAQFPACLFGLGAGEASPSLHSADYDFPDELIDTGVRLFRAITNRALG